MQEQWSSYLDLLDSTVSQLSSKTAVVHESRRVTFGELAAAGDVIGDALKSLPGIERQIVPILLPRGPESFAAIWGVWKAGGAASFVDVTYPADRIKDICDQCSAYSADKPGAGVVIDQDWINALKPFDRPSPEGFTQSSLSPEQPALVVFTSGSSGRSKGVLLPHRAISQAVKGACQYYQEDDEYLSIVSFSFVLLISQELAILSKGATVHLAADAIRQDLPQLAAYALERGITACFLPFLMAGPFLKFTGDRLRVMSLGSEKITNIWTERPALYVSYGSSETAGPILTFHIDRLYDNIPLGLPWPGTSVYLLDEEGKQVQEGEMGELYVSGDQVALGYLNQEELNRDTFIPNPYSKDPHHQLLYRTHDIFRLNAEGYYEFVQRADWMIKVRGYRVEPGEIEAVMRKAAPITNAVAVGFESRIGADAESRTRLYACYTAEEKVDPQVIRAALARELPPYMIPAFIEQVESLPVNVNGKIDRGKIAPPEIERFRADYEAPATETERTICEVFGTVLGLEQAGALDDFVLLGGDSISALKIAMRLSQSFGINVFDILKLRTPRALAVVADVNLRNGLAGGETGETKEDEPVLAEGLELTPYQETFYYEWVLDAERSDYNIVDVRLLERGISGERLNNALIRMVNDYYLFHCNVIDDGERLYWKSREAVPPSAPLLQIFDNPPPYEELLSLVMAPFNLKQDLLFRAFFVNQADGRSQLILVMHHILIDGTKAREIYEEVRNRYTDPAYSAGPDIATQKKLHRGLSKKIRMLLEEKQENIAAFWDTYLKNSVPPELKFLRHSSLASNADRSGVPDSIGVYKFLIDQKNLGRIRVISQKYGITPYIYGQIIFATLLQKMTGQNEIAFSFPSAISEGASLMYGSQANTLLINFSFTRETKITDLIEYAKNYYTGLETSGAKYLPVQELVKRYDAKGMLDLAFAQSNLRYGKDQSRGEFKEITGDNPDNDRLYVDLNALLMFEQEERDNQLYFRVRYKNRVLDKRLVENFAKNYRRVFIEMAAGLFEEINK
jgi:acyl-CoA synthetase (AMP-forming)/AMP-acid ligase II/acyl carrier protein